MPRKLPIIPSHVDVFMLHIFYVLNVITKVGKHGFLFSCPGAPTALSIITENFKAIYDNR